MKLTHIADPRRLMQQTKSKVHFQQPESEATMCGVPLISTIEGITFQQYWPCDLPVNCKRCRVRLELGIRERLYLLTTEQLESLLEASNGHLWENK